MNELWCLSVSRLSSLPDCREDDSAAGESRSSLLSVIELDLEDAPVMESHVCGIVISIALLGILVGRFPSPRIEQQVLKSAMDDAAEQDPSHGSDWAEAPESFR
jgi:hypothetical protein